MEKYLIRPWIHDGYPDPDMTVPPEVEAIAQEVMSRYDMIVNNMTLITAKSDKGGAIWKIDTNRGPRSLKVLHRAPERSLFSVGAQDYLVHQGARVPQLIPTKQGQLYTQGGGKVWIVTEWIESLTPASKIDLAGAQELCYGLGEFHRLSRGYVEPPGASHASRLYRWPKTYEKVLTKIGWFRVLAEVYSDLPASQMLLQVVDKYEDQARRAIQLLDQSSYKQLTERGESAWGLVHQDYGWSNGQNGPGGIWIIDLDGVAFDLPIRDLRKLITGTMDDMGVWDVSWMRGMIDAYNEACPMEPELYEILLIDMALPNELYKNIKEIVYDPVTFMTTELEPLLTRLEASESSKWQALKELGAQLDVAAVKEKYERAKANTSAVTRTDSAAKWKNSSTIWTDSTANSQDSGTKWTASGAISQDSGTKWIASGAKSKNSGTIWTDSTAKSQGSSTKRTDITGKLMAVIAATKDNGGKASDVRKQPQDNEAKTIIRAKENVARLKLMIAAANSTYGRATAKGKSQNSRDKRKQSKDSRARSNEINRMRKEVKTR